MQDGDQFTEKQTNYKKHLVTESWHLDLILNGHPGIQISRHAIFYLWGHLKTQVYKTPPASLQIMLERIENAFMEIKDNPQVVRKAVLAARHRANRCVERNGGQVKCY